MRTDLYRMVAAIAERHGFQEDEIMADPYWRDKLQEDFVDKFSENVEIDDALVKDINARMERIEVVHEWDKHKSMLRKPFQFAGNVDNFETLVRAQKVKFSYDPAPHQAVVRLYSDSSVMFREPYEAFPSDWIMAQIALALACGTR